MKSKTESQIFILPDMTQQYLPHTPESDDWLIVDGAVLDDNGDFIPLDLSDKKLVNNELVDKTSEDLAVERQIESDQLDAQYKTQRQKALLSFDLTVFPDSTLTTEQIENINRVRQEWFDMTSQSNYPFEFVTPAL